MCRVIILANQKGGVAKTTSTVNIGIGLARLGKKVLLIDNDPQGSLSQALGYPQPDKMEVSLANIYEWVLNEDDFDLDEGILHHEEGVDVRSFITSHILIGSCLLLKGKQIYISVNS